MRWTGSILALLGLVGSLLARAPARHGSHHDLTQFLINNGKAVIVFGEGDDHESRQHLMELVDLMEVLLGQSQPDVRVAGANTHIFRQVFPLISLPDSIGCVVSVKGQTKQIAKFPEAFREYLGHPTEPALLKLTKKISRTVKKMIQRPFLELTHMEGLRSALMNQGWLFIFLGKLDGDRMGTAVEFVHRHFGDTFYHIPDTSMVAELLTQNHYSQTHQADFAILFSPLAIDSGDTKALKTVNAEGNLDKLEVFFRYHKHPILIQEPPHQTILGRVLHDNIKVVVLVYDRSTSASDLDAFRKQTEVLPKQFIFVAIDRFDLDNLPVLRLFEESGQTPHTNTVFAIGFQQTRLAAESLARAPLATGAVGSALWGYYQRHLPTFNPDEKGLSHKDFGDFLAPVIEDL